MNSGILLMFSVLFSALSLLKNHTNENNSVFLCNHNHRNVITSSAEAKKVHKIAAANFPARFRIKEKPYQHLFYDLSSRGWNLRVLFRISVCIWLNSFTESSNSCAESVEIWCWVVLTKLRSHLDLFTESFELSYWVIWI